MQQNFAAGLEQLSIFNTGGGKPVHTRVLNEKLDHIKETTADVVATGNPGCQMHIGAGATLAEIPVRVCHPIELVDRAYESAGLYEVDN